MPWACGKGKFFTVAKACGRGEPASYLFMAARKQRERGRGKGRGGERGRGQRETDPLMRFS